MYFTWYHLKNLFIQMGVDSKCIDQIKTFNGPLKASSINFSTVTCILEMNWLVLPMIKIGHLGKLPLTMSHTVFCIPMICLEPHTTSHKITIIGGAKSYMKKQSHSSLDEIYIKHLVDGRSHNIIL